MIWKYTLTLLIEADTAIEASNKAVEWMTTTVPHPDVDDETFSPVTEVFAE